MAWRRRPRVIDVAAPPRLEAGPDRSVRTPLPKVAILAHYSEQPEVSLSVQTLCEQLAAGGYAVLVVSSSPDPAPLSWPRGLPAATSVYRRPNVGYDFGSWAATLEALPHLALADYVILLNDSLIGPFAPIAGILHDLETRTEDAVGLLDSRQEAYHLQSFWVGYRGGVLADPRLRRFWSDIRVEPTKKAIIDRYEIAGTRHLVTNGFAVGSTFPFALVVEDGLNPTSYGWRRLFYFGFPFVKREMVLEPPPDVIDGSAVREVVAERFGEDPLEWV